MGEKNRTNLGDDLIIKLKVECEFLLGHTFSWAIKISTYSHLPPYAECSNEKRGESSSLSCFGRKTDFGRLDLQLGFTLYIRCIDREEDDVLRDISLAKISSTGIAYHFSITRETPCERASRVQNKRPTLSSSVADDRSAYMISGWIGAIFTW